LLSDSLAATLLPLPIGSAFRWEIVDSCRAAATRKIHELGLPLVLEVGVTGSQERIVHFEFVKNRSRPEISWVGNRFFSSRDLSIRYRSRTSNLRGRNDYQELEQMIKGFYQQNGFLSAVVGVEFQAERLSIHIAEGIRYTLANLSATTQGRLPADSLNRILPQFAGEPFTLEAVHRMVEYLLCWCEEHGYPFAKVRVSGWDVGIHRIGVTFRLEEGAKYLFGETTIRGNDITKRTYITRAFVYRRGAPFNQQELDKTYQKLLALDLFSTVNPLTLYVDTASNVTHIQLQVAEGHYTSLEFMLGYNPSSDTGQTTLAGLSGYLNLDSRNIGGRGRKLKIHYNRELARTDLLLAFEEPYVLGTTLVAGADFKVQIDTARFDLWELGFYTVFPLNDFLDLRLRGAYSQANSRSAILEGSLDSLVHVNRWYTETGLSINTTGVQKNPRRGWIVGTTAGYGVRAGFRELHYRIGLNALQNPFGKHVIMQRASFADLILEEGARPFFSEYLAMGGMETLRGYREKEFLATRLLWGGLEYRFLLGRDSFLSLFWDWGLIPVEILILNYQSIRNNLLWSFGLGAWFQTRVGTAGIDFGIPRDAQSIREGKIHLRFRNDF
jgi:outer membrane protein assembly factor BamA